jgi:hypothetical protein
LRDQSSRRLRPAAARAASALLICVDRRGTRHPARRLAPAGA